MVMSECLPGYVDNKGIVTEKNYDLGLNKYKVFKSWEEFSQTAVDEPKKLWKKRLRSWKEKSAYKEGHMLWGKSW